MSWSLKPLATAAFSFSAVHHRWCPHCSTMTYFLCASCPRILSLSRFALHLCRLLLIGGGDPGEIKPRCLASGESTIKDGECVGEHGRPCLMLSSGRRAASAEVMASVRYRKGASLLNLHGGRPGAVVA